MEKSFADRGLKVATLRLMNNVSLDAVVRRQIHEGVVAVVQLYNAATATARIPLKVFNRSPDLKNVNFESMFPLVFDEFSLLITDLFTRL